VDRRGVECNVPAVNEDNVKLPDVEVVDHVHIVLELLIGAISVP
jgi:hypothetical protein